MDCGEDRACAEGVTGRMAVIATRGYAFASSGGEECGAMCLATRNWTEDCGMVAVGGTGVVEPSRAFWGGFARETASVAAASCRWWERR